MSNLCKAVTGVSQGLTPHSVINTVYLYLSYWDKVHMFETCFETRRVVKMLSNSMLGSYCVFWHNESFSLCGRYFVFGFTSAWLTIEVLFTLPTFLLEFYYYRVIDS